MSQIETVQIQYKKCLVFLKRNLERITDNQPPEKFEALYPLLSSLVEETFTHYCFSFFLAHDYFSIFNKSFHLYHKLTPESVVRLLSLSQMIISNTRSASDLNSMIQLPGFKCFFECDFQFDKIEETGDHFVNLVKCVVLKSNSETQFDFIRTLVFKTLTLGNSKDHLVRATVRNIVLTLINLNNSSFEIFIHQIHFKFFFFDVLREIGGKFSDLDRFQLKLQVKEIQNCIFEIQENFQFVDELVNSVKHDEVLCFMFNSFIIGVIVPLILPTFRADFKVKNGKMFGVNSVLFLIDLALRELKNEAINLTISVDVVLKDKIHFINEPQLLDYAIIHGNDYNILKDTLLFTNPGEMRLFESKTENFAAVSQIKRPKNIIKTIEIDPNDKILVCDSIIPSMNRKSVTNEILTSHCNGKVFQTLWAFFRSKDDNMVLITSNILIYIFTNYSVVVDQDIEQVTEKLFELLDSEPLLRMATCKNICHLIYLLYDHLRYSESFSSRMSKLYKQKLNKLKSYFENPKLGNLFVSNFRKTIIETEANNQVGQYSCLILNWLCLVNYTFTIGDSRLFINLDMDYKMDLCLEESVEAELRLFILIRHLRNFVNEKKPSISNSRTFAGLFETENQFVNFRHFEEDQLISIDFTQKQEIKRYFAAKLSNSDQSKVYLASIGRDIVLLEEIENQQYKYKVIFKEFFAHVTAYLNKSNNKHLILKLRNRGLFWTLFFPSSQIAGQSLHVLDELWKNLREMEIKTVSDVLAKLQEEDKVTIVKNFKIEI